MNKPADTVLHLFSSDYRPLYVQDCLDLLSKPRGALQRFRYREEIVSVPLEGEDSLRDAWHALAKKRTEVLVYFVTVREPRPGESVYVPLRRGTVVNTFVEGEFYFVDFSVEEILNPFEYRTSLGGGSADVKESPARLAYLKQLAPDIRALLGDRFPKGKYQDGLEGRFSAVVGARPAKDGGATHSSSDSGAFTQAARALSDLLVSRTAEVGSSSPDEVRPPTADTFIRVVDLRRLRKSGRTSKFRPRTKNRQVKLRGGSQYALDVFQFNARPGFVALGLDLPATLIPITTNQVTLSTPYDIASFQFFAEARDNPTVGEIRLRVHRDQSDTSDGAASSTGATYVLPDARFAVRVVPRRSLSGLSWLVAFGSTLAAFVLTLATLNGVFLTPPKSPTDVIDLSALVQWTGLTAPYLGVDGSALIVAAVAGIGTGMAALGALLRRRFGLTS